MLYRVVPALSGRGDLLCSGGWNDNREVQPCCKRIFSYNRSSSRDPCVLREYSQFEAMAVQALGKSFRPKRIVPANGFPTHPDVDAPNPTPVDFFIPRRLLVSSQGA
jgi:hypothetical protein